MVPVTGNIVLTDRVPRNKGSPLCRSETNRQESRRLTLGGTHRLGFSGSLTPSTDQAHGPVFFAELGSIGEIFPKENSIQAGLLRGIRSPR